MCFDKKQINFFKKALILIIDLKRNYLFSCLSILLTRALRVNLQYVLSQGVIRLELYKLSTFGLLLHTVCV